MRAEKITIGIPCFNAEATISGAVLSALKQEWPNLEVIVLDDFSSDNSPNIVAGMAKQDPRIRLILQKTNTGVGGARDAIVREAQGEFIAFFDDDDQSDPARLDFQRERIIDHEANTGHKLIACYASGKRIYPNGYVLDIPAIGSKPRVPIGNLVADYLLFNGRVLDVFYGSGTPGCALMARKSTIESVGGFDPSFRRVEDSDFGIRLALQGGHFVGCPETLYTQYATTGSDKSPASNLEAELRLLEKYKNYLNEKKMFDYARHWFYFRYYHFIGNGPKAIGALVRCWLGNPWVATRHLLRSAPRRLLHERRMKRATPAP